MSIPPTTAPRIGCLGIENAAGCDRVDHAGDADDPSCSSILTSAKIAEWVKCAYWLLSLGSAFACFSIRFTLPVGIASASDTSAPSLRRIPPSANTMSSSSAPVSGDPAAFCANRNSSSCPDRQAA